MDMAIIVIDGHSLPCPVRGLKEVVSTNVNSGRNALGELVGEKVAAWGETHMGDDYSYVGAVVGATYPEMGKVLRKVMPKAYILVPGYGAQGGKGKDLVHFFNEDGLGAIINSSRGIIAAYKKDAMIADPETVGPEFAEASRRAVIAMKEDLQNCRL